MYNGLFSINWRTILRVKFRFCLLYSELIMIASFPRGTRIILTLITFFITYKLRTLTKERVVACGARSDARSENA